MSSSILRSVFEKLPQHRVSLAFAYGSGVFQQQAATSMAGTSKQMIDLIIATDDSLGWHTANLAQNRSHYSFIGGWGPHSVTDLQRRITAYVYFNTLVPIQLEDQKDPVMIKYGVIQTEDMLRDLKEWDTLYTAGRLHKPVKFLFKRPALDNYEIQAGLDANLLAAIRTALLLLPETFTPRQLFLQICKLSYTGDFRMIFGEDKKKVSKIVTPHMERFNQLYGPVIAELASILQYDAAKEMYTQDTSPTVRKTLFGLLPLSVGRLIRQDKLIDIKVKKQNKLLTNAVSCVVSEASRQQTLKGLLTAGLSKSIDYAGMKIVKMIKSLF